ncbi:hypothetical protein GQ457_09G000660 [Hibiscus cannabinus]
MASIWILLLFMEPVFSATVVEDLANLHPPPDFNTTITSNCLRNPSLRYCSSSPMDLDTIFKFTIVASHLCNESKNPNCVETFPKIDLRNRPKIAPLYLSFDFFWKYCPLTVVSIDLSNNSLKGTFPIDVLFCTQMQALDLSHNGLTGEVPIQSLSPLANLTVLNLSYNHFSEAKISDSRFLKRFDPSCFLQSGIIPSHHRYKIKAMMLLLGFPLVVVFMVGCLWWLCFRRPDYLPGLLQNKHRFTPAMLKVATNGFSKKNIVGKCEGSVTYRGVLRDGTQVRVEIYLDSNNSRDKCHRKYVEECKVLVQLCHKNLVPVYGWCSNRHMRALVTEWIGRVSVDVWLSETAPSWKHRFKVLVGVLKALCYLQDQWPEIGCDVKTSSVLLHENGEPLIARFRVGEDSIAKKIHRFGVFVLEMMTDRTLQDGFEGNEAGFVEYVKMVYPGKLQKVVDEKMKLTENTLDQARQTIYVGLMCADHQTCKELSFGQIYNMITKVHSRIR